MKFILKATAWGPEDRHRTKHWHRQARRLVGIPRLVHDCSVHALLLRFTHHLLPQILQILCQLFQQKNFNVTDTILTTELWMSTLPSKML